MMLSPEYVCDIEIDFAGLPLWKSVIVGACMVFLLLYLVLPSKFLMITIVCWNYLENLCKSGSEKCKTHQIFL